MSKNTNYLCHSKCSLTFTPDRSSGRRQEYSDRTIIELREDNDDLSTIVMAKDVDNGSRTIFEMKLTDKNQYKMGRDDRNPDIVKHRDGTYHAQLDENGRKEFHENLKQRFELLDIVLPSGTTETSQSSDDADRFHDASSSLQHGDDNRHGSRRSESRERNDGRSDRRNSPPRERNDGRSGRRNSPPRERDRSPDRQQRSGSLPKQRETIFSDITGLMQSIRNGDKENAAELAGRLAAKRIRLQTSENSGDDERNPISVQVKIERANGRGDSGDGFPMDVYPSTTIKQLRAAFEYSENIKSVDQYWFVNGRLAHDISSMNDLRVTTGTLFVLFVC